MLIAHPSARADELAQAKDAPANFDAAKYFAGKTMRIIVGFGPGGGTDIQARHFAQHLGDYIPGKPRISVVNITPGITAANRLYGSAPDGLTLEMTAGSNISLQFTASQAKFKIEENRIVGSLAGSSSIMFVRKGFPYKTITDAINGKEVLRVGVRGPDSGFGMRIAAMSKWLNIPVKFIPGLGGTTDNLIALERGDVDGYLPGGGGNVWFGLPFIRPGWLKDGTIRAWSMMGPSNVKVGANSEAPAPDVAYVTDLLKDPEQKRLYDLFAQVDAEYGKLFMAPPNTPDHIMKVLRTSYEALLADKAFRTKLEEIMGEPVDFTPGDKVETDFDDMVKGYAENKEKFDEWMTWAQELF